MQAPKIDKRTYDRIVAQAEVLAETLTQHTVPPSAEMLTGRTLADDIIELGTDPEGKPKTIPAGTVVDGELARRISRVPGLDHVKVKGWRPTQPLDAGGALIRIFGRFMELLVDRLNRVPEKNFLAFLNLIGADVQPPQAARAPLTFVLAEGSPVDGLVPAGTQAAAPPAEGEEEGVIFETDQELVVTRAQLKAVLVREPAGDQYGNYTERALGDKDEAFPAFSGDQLIEHSLYLARDDFFTLPGPKTITLIFVAPPDAPQPANLPLTWSYWDGQNWEVLSVKSKTENGQGIVTIENLPAPASRQINGQEAAWLRAQLDVPLPSSPPAIEKITASVNIKRTRLAPDLAFANSLPLDLSKDFYPFGEAPRLNDAFYLSSQEAFSRPGAQVTVHLSLSDPQPIVPKPSADLVIAWEVWTGNTWTILEVRESPSGVAKFATSGTLSFDLPKTIGPRLVNGETGYWIRARIVKGNFGTPVTAEWNAEQNKIEMTGGFGPPSVALLSLGYKYAADGPLTACQTCNDFAYLDQTKELTEDGSFLPFTPSAETDSALFLGFDQPFANRPVSLYVQVEPPSPDEVSPPDLAAMTITTRPQVTWEYAGPDGGWTPLGAVDETRAFVGRGLIRFIGPRDFTSRQLFGQALYWVRARSEGGEFAVRPRLRRLLLNTTWASQATTVQNETLGSSNGNPGQAFQLARVPALPGLCLEVREPEMPSPEEQAEISTMEGPDAITTILDAAGQPEEIWVRWHAVPDFHGSGPRDRHYTLDHLSGTVGFGDGRYGLVPPAGQNNVRAARYRSGGGAGGNRPRETVIQLRSSVPYIDRVTNFEEASGGADRQSLDRVKRYGPRQLRHRGRAVTAEDLEDLACAASAEVARAKAVPPPQRPLDLWLDPGTKTPDTQQHQGIHAGVTGLIVIPRSDRPRPVPSLGLLEEVKTYLLARCPVEAELWVAGPHWVEVTVSLEFVPTSLAAADLARDRLTAALERFLHPLTGGPLGKGWQFGRRPRESDLYALAESLEGVDHVLHLNIDPSEDKGLPDQYMIFSGQHRIELVSDQ
jgi:hypothetical protein